MKLKTKIWYGLLALCVTASVWAADSKKTTVSAGAGAPDPAMMEMMKLGMPGDNHKVLEPLTGKWTAVVRGWMKPGDKPQESKGMIENTWVLGGRYLKQDFKGDWAGQPFEGTGYTGYDNMRHEYQSIWMDNMSSGMMQTTGVYDPGSKTINSGGHFSCPMTGEKDRWVRSVLKIIDNDNNTYTSYFKDATGKEFKSMEIIYARMK